MFGIIDVLAVSAIVIVATAWLGWCFLQRSKNKCGSMCGRCSRGCAKDKPKHFKIIEHF